MTKVRAYERRRHPTNLLRAPSRSKRTDLPTCLTSYEKDGVTVIELTVQRGINRLRERRVCEQRVPDWRSAVIPELVALRDAFIRKHSRTLPVSVRSHVRRHK